MIEFANALDRLLQLLIIGEQAANLGDPLASHAELPCASTAIADCQNEDPVSFTARTFWAVLGNWKQIRKSLSKALLRYIKLASA